MLPRRSRFIVFHQRAEGEIWCESLFFGATRTVTGSKYLVQSDRSTFLVDCGLFQGRKELRLKNWDPPPFSLASIDGVILTHAHIDHVGYLPRIVRQGFRKPIFCTPATLELTRITLQDTARLQEEEASFANEVHSSKHHPAEPLYTQNDAAETLKLLRPIPKSEWSEPLPGVRVFPSVAGHILGACSLTIEVDGKRINFSGDIGRYDVPILPDPAPIEIGDLLVCESTYGDRDHAPEDVLNTFERALREALMRGGPIIIPAFAIGRTQTILYYIRQLEDAGRIPPLPVYVDSPMAIDVTEIHERFKYDFDEEAKALLGKNQLVTTRTVFCRTSQESKNLNRLSGSRVIIAGSGMVNGGRVLHHLRRWAPHPETTVLFVGFQGEETRGAHIQHGAPEIKIFGQLVPIRAHVESISGLSAHGDRGELLRWLRSSKGTPRVVRITHGEPSAAVSFSTRIKSELGWDARPAEYAETVEV